MRMKTVKEVLPIDNTGIFSSFKNPVWAEVLPNTTELDQYFNLRYGDRILNRKMEFFLNDEEKISGTKLISLSDMIYSINKNRWKHLFEAYMVEYNPIENTDYIETFKETIGNTKVIDTDRTNTNVVDGTDTSTEVHDGNIVNTKVTDNETVTNGTATTESSGTNSASTSTDNAVFGFNSALPVGKDSTTGSDSNNTSADSETTTNSTVSEDGTVTDTNVDTSKITTTDNTDVTTTDTGSEDSTITDEGNKEYELRKHGNIGVTTNVTMLREDIDFWWKWSFVDYVCQDICDFIALSIY